MTDDMLQYRTFWRRFGASLVDGIIFMPLMWPGMWILSHASPPVILAWICLGSAISFTYTIGMHAAFGQTIGKMVTRIQVRDVSGRPLRPSQAVRREAINLALFLVSLGFYVSRALSGDPIIAEKVEDLTLTMQIQSYLSYLVLAIELLTMMTNERRRAVHDFVAGSVVLKTSESPVARIGSILATRAPRTIS
ncbi:MAG: RDD domain containing protein [bacterium]|nr:MAG: RDD domain containing protein [bacterium]